MNKKKNTVRAPVHPAGKKSSGPGEPPSAAQPASPAAKNGEAEHRDIHCAPVQWKPWLDSYRDLRALQFSTREHFAAAAQLLWTGDLRDLPYDLVGNHTIVVPAEAVPFFRGLDATETDVLHPGDMPAQELSDLRKEQGPY
jgi:hypothetical protein